MDKKILEQDTFEVFDAIFNILYEMSSGRDTMCMIHDYVKYAKGRDVGLNVIRSNPIEFMEAYNLTSKTHMALLYLTSPSTYGDKSLAFDDVYNLRLSADFINGKFDKSVVNRKNNSRNTITMVMCADLRSVSIQRLIDKFAKTNRVLMLDLMNAISVNTSLTLDMVKSNIGLGWSWERLNGNPALDPVEIISENLWASRAGLSKNPRLTADTVNANPGIQWDASAISRCMATRGIEQIPGFVVHENIAANPTFTSEFAMAHIDEIYRMLMLGLFKIPGHGLENIRVPSDALLDTLTTRILSTADKRTKSFVKAMETLGRLYVRMSMVIRYSDRLMEASFEEFSAAMESMWPNWCEWRSPLSLDFTVPNLDVAKRILANEGIHRDLAGVVAKYMVPGSSLLNAQ